MTSFHDRKIVLNKHIGAKSTNYVFNDKSPCIFHHYMFNRNSLSKEQVAFLDRFFANADNITDDDLKQFNEFLGSFKENSNKENSDGIC